MFEDDNNPSSPEALHRALSRLAHGEEEDDIVFDPRTGQISVIPRGKPLINDAVPATVVAGRGFFASTAETLARNAGIVESSVLADRSVAIIGLGSGGSLLADQLARAGVGNLVLVDFDILEAHNVGRHLCDVADLGRPKTDAVADAVRRRAPGIGVRTVELDVVANPAALAQAVEGCDVLVGATDGNPSRRVINRLAIETSRPAVFGRAYARASGGDVLRTKPGGPCWECTYGGVSAEEEVSSARSASAVAYSDRPVVAEPGLALDIAPIALMCARLVLAELVRGRGSAIESLDADLAASLYLWANRREGQFVGWKPMEFGIRDFAVQRWYGLRSERVVACPACGEEEMLRAMLAGQLGSAAAG